MNAAQSPWRVLVVDDDEDIRLLCRLTLEHEGFEISELGGGDQIVDATRRQDPDLILLDLMMPGPDGWECLERLKSDTYLREIPVVMLTARTSQEDRRRALTWAADYVTKPFEPDALVRVVREVIDRVGRRARPLRQEQRLPEPS